MSTFDKRKKTSSLSPEQLRLKRIKDLEVNKRRACGDFSFGKFKTRGEFLKYVGAEVAKDANDASISVDIVFVKSYFDEQINKIKSASDEEILQPQKITISAPTPQQITSDALTASTESAPPLAPSAIPDILPALHDNKAVKFVPKQNEAAVKILRNFFDNKFPGQLLLAPTGAGKTYIFGAVIRELIDRSWAPLLSCTSPYPIVVVTRATIVEQTERVLSNQFGLTIGVDVDVTNIDQFRAKFGDRFIEEKTIVKWAEVHITYEWREKMAPVLLVLDECQSVKNEDSTQSKIFQAFNELDGEHYLLGSSATPFTRVSEAKVFAVSTRLKWQ